jgi:hypothetical protein
LAECHTELQKLQQGNAVGNGLMRSWLERSWEELTRNRLP